MDTYESIQKTFLGTTYGKVDTVILTPIQSIFNEFIPEFQEQNSGWWQNGIINTDKVNNSSSKRKLLVIKSPIGSHIEDTIAYAPKTNNILLLGYCGSYNKDICVGDSFSCSSAVDDVSEITASITMPAQHFGKIYQVKNFHSQFNSAFKQLVLELGFDCVDMESYSAFKTTKNKIDSTVRFGATHIVTDTEQKPFYKISEEELKLIRFKTKELVKSTLDYLITK